MYQAVFNKGIYNCDFEAYNLLAVIYTATAFMFNLSKADSWEHPNQPSQPHLVPWCWTKFFLLHQQSFSRQSSGTIKTRY